MYEKIGSKNLVKKRLFLLFFYLSIFLQNRSLLKKIAIDAIDNIYEILKIRILKVC